MKEAMFWKALAGKKVQCQLCPRFCTIAEGKTGYCGVRQNRDGKLCSLVYGKPCSVNADPIEKKPLFHFAPGTACLSVATVGCNLSCNFCQNWTISHPSEGEIFGEEITAKGVIEMTKGRGLPGIAYTYTEPLIAIEFYLEIMKLAREAGLYNVWVSNGYINPEPAKMAAKYMDAINVDLKGDGGFYKRVCGVPDPKPILDSMKIFRKAGVWVEVTNLLIPGHNDKESQIRELALWVRKNLGPETPLHFSRFYPCYKMENVKPTPVETLESAWRVAKDAGMEYVYIGNVPGHPKESTCCPSCGEVAIKRAGYHIEFMKRLAAKGRGSLKIRKGGLGEGLKCEKCKENIPLAGMKWIRVDER